MTRGIAIAALLLIASLQPASAQVASRTGGSAAGNVGSVTLRNGFPAGAGAVALPALAPSASIVTSQSGTVTSTTGNGLTSTALPGTGSAATTTGSTGAPSSGVAASGGSGGGFSGSGVGGAGGARAGNGASSSAAAGNRGSRGSSSGNWVLCPPGGASGLEPLLTGTGLSCAPD